MKTNPKPYEWDYFGACEPTGKNSWITFSLGIFQWLPKAGGRGLKRGKVIKRVRGNVIDKADVYAKADEIVDELNKGEK